MELTIGQLIKIILGMAVVVAVVAGIGFFGSNVTDFFNNLVPSEKPADENPSDTNEISYNTFCEDKCAEGETACDYEKCESVGVEANKINLYCEFDFATNDCKTKVRT